MLKHIKLTFTGVDRLVMENKHKDTSWKINAKSFLSIHLKSTNSENSTMCSQGPWYTMRLLESRIMSLKKLKSAVLAAWARWLWFLSECEHIAWVNSWFEKLLSYPNQWNISSMKPNWQVRISFGEIIYQVLLLFTKVDTNTYLHCIFLFYW